MHLNKRYIFFIYLKQSNFARILHYLQKFVLIHYTVNCCWSSNIISYKLKLNLNMQNEIPVQCSQTSHGHPYYNEMVSA